MPFCTPTTNTISEIKIPVFRSFSKVCGELLQLFVNILPLKEISKMHIIYLKLRVSFHLGQSETVFITIFPISNDPGNRPEFQMVTSLNWSESPSSIHPCLPSSHIPTVEGLAHIHSTWYSRAMREMLLPPPASLKRCACSLPARGYHSVSLPASDTGLLALEDRACLTSVSQDLEESGAQPPGLWMPTMLLRR